MKPIARYSEHHTVRIAGHKPICSCDRSGEYSERFDAYYCKNGNLWLEKGCKDKKCQFCQVRPEHPMPLEKL